MSHRFAVVVGVCLTLVACGEAASDSSASGEGAPTGSFGLAPGGVQDFGQFKSILEGGAIPGPETLDELGFFAEHKIEMPEADCGEAVCLHGLLGAMGNFIDGVGCSLLVLGLNTPLDPATLPRPPLNLVVAVDLSSHVSAEAMGEVRAGLKRMVQTLEPGDTVAFLPFADSAFPISATHTVGADDDALQAAIDHIVQGHSPTSPANLYDGLLSALDHVDSTFDPERQNRVLLVSSGALSAGVTNPAQLQALAAGYARAGISITSVGIDDSFDLTPLQQIAEVGAGNYYFVDEPQDVREVFVDEMRTFFVPVATDVVIEVEPGPGYTLAEAFGTRAWTPLPGGGGRIEIPALFVAGRTDATAPTPEGRRGGGGAILIEAMPTGGPGSTVSDHVVGQLHLTWRDPLTGDVVATDETDETGEPSGGTSPEQTVTVESALPPGDYAPNGTFTNATAEKAFVMLNLFVAFRMATELAADGDAPTALAILEAVRDGVSGWLTTRTDADIEDDLTYVDLFIEALIPATYGVEVVSVPPPWAYD